MKSFMCVGLLWRICRKYLPYVSVLCLHFYRKSGRRKKGTKTGYYLFSVNRQIIRKIISVYAFSDACIVVTISSIQQLVKMGFCVFGESSIGFLASYSCLPHFSYFKSMVDNKSWIFLCDISFTDNIHDKLIH